MVKISDKLKNSIKNRATESETGRILIPTDLKKKYSKETGIIDKDIINNNIIKIINEDILFR